MSLEEDMENNIEDNLQSLFTKVISQDAVLIENTCVTCKYNAPQWVKLQNTIER